MQITLSNFSMEPCSVGMPPITVTTKNAKAAQVVGDEYKGTRLYRPLNGLEITNLTQHAQGNLQLGAEFITKAHEIFVYCVGMSFNDALKNEFDAKACVEICDPLK